MQDYEMGALNYDTYRRRRNAIIDEYAGIEKRKLTTSANYTYSNSPVSKSTENISTSRIAFTLALIVLAVFITYIATKNEKSSAEEQFVDSRIMTDDSNSGKSK